MSPTKEMLTIYKFHPSPNIRLHIEDRIALTSRASPSSLLVYNRKQNKSFTFQLFFFEKQQVFWGVRLP